MPQNIEFFVHPPSPRIYTGTKLPPVSSLLSTQVEEEEKELPLLCLSSSPTTSQHSLEAVEPSSSTSYCYSPPFMGSLSLDSPPQLSPQTSPYSTHLMLPLPTNTRRSRSSSNASTISTISYSQSIPDPTLYDDEEEEEEIVVTQKRKRGRPPNSTRHTIQQQCESYTFVTPTVWDVKGKEEQEVTTTANEDCVVLHWPQTEGQNTFTNIKMDTALSMPKKKRGRKPKMQLAGNFCFVWRDLTAPRGANKKK
ncbi:unnamed protein product [Mucor hiemalis]